MKFKSFILWAIISLLSGAYLYYNVDAEGFLSTIAIIGLFLGGIMAFFSLLRPSKSRYMR